MPNLPVDKVVPSHLVNPDDIRCPDCGGNNLVLEGFAQRKYAVQLTEGKVTEEVLDKESEWTHDVKIITCLNPRCEAVYKVMSQELWSALHAVAAGTRPC